MKLSDMKLGVSNMPKAIKEVSSYIDGFKNVNPTESNKAVLLKAMDLLALLYSLQLQIAQLEKSSKELDCLYEHARLVHGHSWIGKF